MEIEQEGAQRGIGGFLFGLGGGHRVEGFQHIGLLAECGLQVGQVGSGLIIVGARLGQTLHSLIQLRTPRQGFLDK